MEHKKYKLTDKQLKYLINRRKEKNQKFFRILNNTGKSLKRITYIILDIVFIGLVSALAGMQSESLIYTLNKPLGLGYAHFASYVEAGLIGTILGFLIFRRKKQ